MTRTLVCAPLTLILAGCATTPDRHAATGNGDAVRPAHATDPVTVRPAAPEAPAPMLFELSARGLPEAGMWKCDPVFADVNRDGHLDLAGIPRLGNGPRVWFGDGKGNWTNASNGLNPVEKSCGGGVVVIDLDMDGHLDLAVADHCTGVYVYLGDSRGNWRMVTEAMNPEVATGDPEVATWVGSEDLDVGDVNGDGHLDLLVAGSDEGGLNIYYGDGSGSSWQRQETSLPGDGWANRVRLTDVNADGRPDVVATFSQGPRVWHNDGAGDFTEASQGLPSPMMHGLFHGLDVADANNDGRPDLIVANWVDGPEAYLQQADGSWRKTADVFPDMLGGAIGIAAGHVDKDGNLDLVVAGRLSRDAGYVRGVFLLLGDGRGSWTFVRNCGLPDTGLTGVAGVALGDFDSDGWLDVAAASGLSVESTPGPSGPVVPQRVLMWRAEPTVDSTSLAEVPEE